MAPKSQITFEPGLPSVRDRDSYTAATIAACELALRTLLAKVGRWGPHLIVFGGLTPRYLVQHPPEGLEPHIGTTDIDVVIGVVLPEEHVPLYATLEQKLVDAGFQRWRNRETGQRESFRWERNVNGIGVNLEFFCPPGDAGPGRLRRRPQSKSGNHVTAIGLRGAELAGRDSITVTLSGDTLDHGGARTVEVKVVNLLPFLVLKAFALHGRDKDKDAYDIVWMLNAFSNGPAGAAAYAARSVVLADPDVSVALDLLRQHFESLDAAGPSLYARFLSEDGDDARRVDLRRYASATVREFLMALARLQDPSADAR